MRLSVIFGWDIVLYIMGYMAWDKIWDSQYKTSTNLCLVIHFFYLSVGDDVGGCCTVHHLISIQTRVSYKFMQDETSYESSLTESAKWQLVYQAQ